MKLYFVYILASQNGKVLYIGITNDLPRRLYEHQHGLVKGFTKKYQVHKLVYYEAVEDVRIAIEREKQLKNWHREWKLNLIEQMNPGWEDLSYLVYR